MKNKENANKSTIQFMGIATQMMVTILLFAFLGYGLDQKFEIKDKYLTAASTLFGVLVSFYVLFKQLLKE
jgi:F0F1-type ATP synthase assembly protein I